MHFKQIKQIARYNTSRSARRKDNTTILDGLHLIEEALLHEMEHIQEIYYTDRAQKENPEIASLLMRTPHIAQERVSAEIMQKIASTDTPPGILATLTPPLAPRKISSDVMCIVVLDTVSDPGNVGAIIRSAVALGADMIVLSTGCADAWSPKVLRAAQGAHFSIPLLSDFDLTTLADKFDGAILGAFLGDGAQSIYDKDLTSRVALCVGNEGAGINEEQFASYGTGKVFIPMQREFESLNVAIATSIMLAERSRQLDV